MKAPLVSRLVALALLFVDPVVASRCRPSKASSVSVSSSASSRASPSPSTVCDVNVVDNGNFASTVDPWAVTRIGSAGVSAIAGCGGAHATCAEISFDAAVVYISQSFPTVVGKTYAFSFAYNPLDYGATTAFSCEIVSGSESVTFSQTLSAENTWVTFSGPFLAMSESTTVYFYVLSSDAVELALTDVSASTPC